MTENQAFARRLVERYGDPTPELQVAYDSWLADMAARPHNVLAPFEFDPEKYPEQSILVAKTEAHDPHPTVPDAIYYPAFFNQAGKSMGYRSLYKLVRQMRSQPASSEDPTPLSKRLAHDRMDGKNTLVVTSHHTFQEFGYFKAVRFLAKKDREHIARNGALLNKLMSRQSYRGKTLAQRLTPIGPVYWSYPKSASADKHNVPAKAMRLGNALFTHAIEADLETGGLELDAALSGSEIKPVYDETGHLTHNRIPDIDPASAKLLEEFNQVVGAAMVKDPASGEWQMEIGELLDVDELLKTHTGIEITDMVYGPIVKAVERMTGIELEYNRLAPLAVDLGRLATKTS